MLRIEMDYDSRFEALYNKFNSTPKGRDYLRLSGISRDKLDISTMSKQFFKEKTSDMSVDPNSNVGQNKCFLTYQAEVRKGLDRLNGYYLMWKYLTEMYDVDYANLIISDCIKGLFYPHDLTKWNIPYCIAISTLPLLVEGRPYGQLHSFKPKRRDSYMAQVREVVMDLSQEMAGAVAISDLLVNYSWFLHNEGSNIYDPVVRKNIENDIQEFIHVINNPFRVGGDSPFTNISIYDRPTLRSVFANYVFPDFKKIQDIEETVMEVEKIFMEFMSKKDPHSKLPYRFPIVTVNIFTETFHGLESIVDEEFVEIVSKYNTEGIFNIYITNDCAKISSCCRYVSDIKELTKQRGIDSFGNGGISIGSHRVVTVNLCRIARESTNITDFISKLRTEFKVATDILIAHRNLIKDRIEQGFLKFFKPLNWLNLDRMFYSTIGICGFWEAMTALNVNILEDMETPVFVLSQCSDICTQLIEEYNIPINLEQTPAEGSAINLAAKDEVYFGDNKYKIYSNQFIPLWEDVDLPTRAKVDGLLSKLFSGGSISHLNIGSKATPEQMKSLIYWAVINKLKHFALNPNFSVCEKGHVNITGHIEICPDCGGKIVEHLTRIVGYFTNVGSWVKERREIDYPNRKYNYKIGD